jgi:hypothetical protein
VYAPPQSGKSTIKALVISICFFFQKKIPVFILTNGIAEKKDLYEKLRKQAPIHRRKYITLAPDSKDSCQERKKKLELNKEALRNGGTVIFSDSVRQVDTVRELVKFYHKEVREDGHKVFIVDEADSIVVRTRDEKQKFEQQLAHMNKELRPTVSILFTATPIQNDLCAETIDQRYNSSGENSYYEITPGEDYNSLLKGGIKPPKDEYGMEVYLSDGELSKKEPYRVDGLSIPYASERTVSFCRDAAAAECSLLLDNSCPWVNVDENNVQWKAESVQQLLSSEGLSVIVIAFTGQDGISVKFPGEEWDKVKWKDRLIGELLENIDQDPKCGLKIPVFIFGTPKKMGRCISFRSNKRVPSHLILYLGDGHNNSNNRQAIGRLEGYAKSQLLANGLECALVLTRKGDFIGAKNHDHYVEHVNKRLKKGDSMHEAVHGTNEKVPHNANMFACNVREVGMIPNQRSQALKHVQFGASRTVSRTLGTDTREVTDVMHQSRSPISIDTRQVAEAMHRISSGESRKVQIHKDDIFGHFLDQDGVEVDPSELQNSLDDLVEKGIIEKDHEKEWYSIKVDLEALKQFACEHVQGNNARSNVVSPEKRQRME